MSMPSEDTLRTLIESDEVENLPDLLVLVEQHHEQERKALPILHECVKYNSPRLLEAFLSMESFPLEDTVLQTNTDKYTPLMLACVRGHAECAEKLIAHGANTHVKKMDKGSLLHPTAVHGHMDLMVLLLQSGIPVDHPDKYGNTALFYACKYGHLNIVTVLLQHHAQVNLACQHVLKNQKCRNQTALYCSIQKHHYEVAEVLIAHGAKNCTDLGGTVPLDLARAQDDVPEHLLLSLQNLAVCPAEGPQMQRQSKGTRKAQSRKKGHKAATLWGKR